MKHFIVPLLTFAVTTGAQAQTSPAVAQTDSIRQQREAQDLLRNLGPGDDAPALYDEDESDLGPQMILRERKNRWFRTSVDVQVHYTDNMFFLKDGDVDTALAITTFEGAVVTPPCITRWASYRAEVGYRYQFFEYFGKDEPISPFVPFRRDDYSFESSTAFADVVAQTAHYQFRAGFDYTHLFGNEPLRPDGKTFYREAAPRWSVQRNFRVCDWSQFSVAYLGAYRFADEEPILGGYEDRHSRWEHSAVAAYSIALPGDVVIQPYYRYQFSNFDEFETQDFSEQLHTAGLGIGWYPSENFSVRLFGNYNWASSDFEVREYDQLNVGGGLNLTFRF